VRTPLLLALSALLLSTAASAAPITEVIALRHVSAPEVELLLLGVGGLKRKAPEGTEAVPVYSRREGFSVRFPEQTLTPSGPPLVPKGISGLTADTRTNSLVLVGEPEAIAQVRKMVTLIDIPQRQIQLLVRVLELNEGARVEFGAAALHNEGLRTSGPLTPDEVRKVEEQAKSVLLNVLMPCSDSRPLRLFMPTAAPGDPKISEITPRISGDGTITLFMPLARSLDADKAPSRPVFLLHRLKSAQTVLITTEGLRTAVLISATLLPPAKAQ
jgi:hypothetical protein